MRKRIKEIFVVVSAVLMLCLCSVPAQAQMPTTGQQKAQAPQRKAGSAWRLLEPLGLHIPSTIDTLRYNYQQQSIPSMISPAFATTGNLGAPGQNEIFFERPERQPFFFSDALFYYTPSIDNETFYNVYIPMTLLSYNTGGNKRSNQDRLRATFAGNVNRRIGIGGNLDYLHSKGSYENQAVKHFNFGFQGYYKGDRYEMQAFFNHYHMLNKENGGITNDMYITDPAELQGGVSKIEPKSIPTRLSNAHSRINGMELYLNQAYNVGYWRQEEVNDTLTRDVYVPMLKFIWTFDYQRDRHLFLNKGSGNSFWANHYLDVNNTSDNTLSNSVRNTVGVHMIEGFRPWVKFGLSAYATYELRKYNQTPDSVLYLPDRPADLTPLPEGFSCPQKATQNLLWVGGQLTKQTGSMLSYEATARFGLVGDVAGDVDVTGRIDTRFKLLGDTVQVSANAMFRNTAQPYLLQHYISNHFAWDNDFSKTKDLRFGGEIFIPWTDTRLSAGFENINDYVYFDNTGMPRQYSGGVQIFSANLEQQLAYKILHWDNRLTYQTSSKQEVIALPALAWYSNLYVNFKAFRVLDVQAGVDCNYYTRYYAPSYQPATMSFCTQQETKVGNYAFMNLYVTCKLKKTRFYLMWTHVNQGWFSNNYFSMPHYPLNPRRFQIGLSVDFAN